MVSLIEGEDSLLLLLISFTLSAMAGHWKKFLGKSDHLQRVHTDTWCSRRTFDGQSDFTGMVLHAKRLTLCGSDMKVYLTMDKFLYFIVARNILNRNWVFFFVCYYTWYVKLLHNSHIWWLLLSSIKTMNSIMFHKKKKSTLIRHFN